MLEAHNCIDMQGVKLWKTVNVAGYKQEPRLVLLYSGVPGGFGVWGVQTPLPKFRSFDKA